LKTLLSLVVFVVLTAGAAAFGAQFMPGQWYAALAKPAWTPPNSVFGPVWSVLYVAIAVAGWLAWRSRTAGTALVFWGAGLILNAAWSMLFFGRHLIGVALLDIVLLLATIVGFVITAWPHARLASILFLPYLAWVGYATALNFAIWRLNP
jgi:benzodiazapine receptor